MLLVNVIIIMLIRMGEASLITVTRTNPPDASITSPPPLHGRGQQGKRDETVTIRGPGTCGFLTDEEGAPPLTCADKGETCATSKVRDVGDGIDPLSGVACCQQTRDCVFPTSCVEMLNPIFFANVTPDPSVLTCRPSAYCNTYIWPQNLARFYSCVPLEESQLTDVPQITDHFVADFFVIAPTTPASGGGTASSSTNGTPTKPTSGAPIQTTPPLPSDQGNGAMTGLSLGAKAAIIVACIVVVAIILTVLYFFRVYLPRKKRELEERINRKRDNSGQGVFQDAQVGSEAIGETRGRLDRIQEIGTTSETIITEKE